MMGIRTGNPAWVDSATVAEAEAHPSRKITAAKLNAIEDAIDDSAEATHTHDVGDIDATGTADSTTYLRGDGTWATPAGGGGVTDHGALTGLGDDDHTQYALADGSRGSFATAAQGAKADAAIPSGLVDAKGDLIVATADNTVTRLPAGTNGHVLTADSSESAGVKWAAPAGGGGAVDVDVSAGVALWPLTPTGGTTARYGSAQSIASAWLPHGVTVHRLIITCVAAESGGEMYVRLYQGFDSTNTVTAVTEVVTFDLSATGTVSVALSAPVDLDPGLLFIGWAHGDDTSATVRSGVTNVMLAAAVASSAVSNRASRFLSGSGGSSLPTTASISSPSAPNPNAPPAIGLGLA